VECANCQAEIPEGGDSCTRCGWQAPSEKVRFAQLNAVFAGRYDFLRLLGIGGFAEVYLARDVLLERDVAVKILLPQHAQDPQTVERFLREAKLYAKLEHANIIPIYDTGVLQGHVFITMKYIRGESLKHVLTRQKRIDPRLLPDIAAGVAQALAYIHPQGIVHRDIKPANIIVEKATRTVYLADFGIARAESSQTLTQTGMIVGTPHYLSPEQIQGKKIDPRSDIYALGASLYELASGQPPFQGDSPLEILYQHINERAVPLAKLVPGIDPSMENIISRCIEKDPARRFQKAEDIVFQVEKAERTRKAAQEKTALAATMAPRRKKSGRWLIVAGLFASLAATAYFLWFRTPRPAPPQETAAASSQARQAPVIKPQAAVAVEPKAGGTDAKAQEGGETKKPGLKGGEAGKKNPEQAQAAPGPASGDPEAAARPDLKPPAAAAAPGTIRFSSFPPQADIFHKGEKIGGTEQVFEKSFPPGEYVFNFSIPGYQSAEVRVSLASGETVSAHHRFPPFRSFTITARPFGRVQVDGRDYGDTPQTIKLAYGEHLVRVIKEGYRSEESKITISQDSRNSAYFELKKEEKK
jgi:serine/threonine-protein kinase